ncbi:purine-cytosine permease family protein [Pseudonocardia hispaniensis]|uniref:Purine-cytosine permease family protein n=1 Tax=Pseudonocardia hispaniensis TaxID=904933 RepID=A0ABW1J7G0_9PSEU
MSSTDDPRVVAEAATEDYTVHATPLTWRMGRLSLASVWWALASAMFWLILGALVALTVGTVDAIIGMVLAALVYGGINAVFCGYAARTGLTANLFSRALFGHGGSVIAPILVALTAIYFACFEGSVIAVALEAYFGGLPIQLWYLVVVLYSVPLILGALRMFLDKFNGALFPFYVVGLVAVVVWTVLEHGYDDTWVTRRPETLPVSGPGWWWAFTTYLADFVLMMATWDFARFARRTAREQRFHRWVTFGPVFYLFTIVVNGLVGIFVAMNIPTEGPLTEISGVLGIVGLMGFSGVVFVWISQTRINTTNFYLAVTNLESFTSRVLRVRLPRVAWGVLVGAAVYLVMLSNVFDFILVALRYQAVLAVTWTACALTFILMGRLTGAGDAEWRPGRVPRFNWVGVGAWSAGTVVGFAMLTFGAPTSWTGTWALPVAFLVSATVQAVGSLATPGRGRAVLERPHDPREEVGDVWADRVRCHVCERFYVAVEMDRDPAAGHEAICAEHAQANPTFQRAAVRDAAAFRDGTDHPIGALD